jgi:nickel-dependent lactate racemase
MDGRTVHNHPELFERRIAMMQDAVYRVPFGKTEVEFSLPPGMLGTLVTSRKAEPIADIEKAVQQALAHPIDSPPLNELARPGQTVCILFTDITRSSPDRVLVSALLAELERGGIRPEDITLLCATGMHRPSTAEEKAFKLGKRVAESYQVLDHEPTNPEALVDIGQTETGIPVSINRKAYEADLIIATGIVEPHQYAGYSGGGKVLAIGAGSEDLIAFTHGPHMLDHPATRLGVIDRNPFQEAVAKISSLAGLRFIINVVQDDEKRPIAVCAGEPQATFRRLVEDARKVYEVPIPRRFDLAVAGVGFPKDVNLYQATRAVSYLFFAPTCVVREGGLFILPAPTPEGVGGGLGEQAFLEKMRGATNMSSLLTELRRTGYPPGAQRAFVMAKVLEKTRVIVVGSETPELVSQMKMIPASDMNAAFRLASRHLGRRELDVLVVPHAMLTLPVVSSPPSLAARMDL